MAEEKAHGEAAEMGMRAVHDKMDQEMSDMQKLAAIVLSGGPIKVTHAGGGLMRIEGVGAVMTEGRRVGGTIGKVVVPG